MLNCCKKAHKYLHARTSFNCLERIKIGYKEKLNEFAFLALSAHQSCVARIQKQQAPFQFAFRSHWKDGCYPDEWSANSGLWERQVRFSGKIRPLPISGKIRPLPVFGYIGSKRFNALINSRIVILEGYSEEKSLVIETMIEKNR